MDFCSLENSNKEKSCQCNFIFYKSFLIEEIMWLHDSPLLKEEIIKWFYFIYFYIRLESFLIKKKNSLTRGELCWAPKSPST